MTTHQARRRLKQIHRAARKAQKVRTRTAWVQLTRPQDSKAADDDEEGWAPE